MKTSDVTRRRDGAAPDSGVHPGIVTRVVDGAAWVEVPSVARGWEYGPCAVPTDWRDWTHTVEVGGAGDAAHTHAVAEHRPANLTAGTRVAVLLHPGGHLLLARY